MFRFGITGRSGAGKSTVARLFEPYGVVHVDADKVAHRIYEPGTPCAAELAAHFGEQILNEDGSINRKILGGIVFSDAQKLAELSRITHRYVRLAIEEIEREEQAKGTKALLVDAIALLESGLEGEAVIAVAAPYDLLLHRIMERDGLEEQQARQRLNAQKEESYFLSNADYVVINDSDQEALQKRVHEIAQELALCE